MYIFYITYIQYIYIGYIVDTDSYIQVNALVFTTVARGYHNARI